MPADKTFLDFLKSAPAAKDALGGKTAVVSGTVYRGDADDKFVLTTSDGQTTEVPVEAVQRFKIVDQTGLNALVQLEINTGSLGHSAYTLKELIKDPTFDTRKELAKDPIWDTRKELAKDPVWDTYKEVVKEPIKEPIWDPPGTLWGDPPGGTLQEGIDWGDPSQGVVNPAVGVGQQFGQQYTQQGMQQGMPQQGGMMPFIMATPHHASQAAIQMQQNPHIATTYVADHVIPKPAFSDHFQDPITRKELLWDTGKEPIMDPQTRWEGGGGHTQQEGVGNPGQFDQPVWNLPGMMF
jgi:hypothetical protein